MKPQIFAPIMAFVSTFGGHGPYWYTNLTNEERADADRLACLYANRMFYRDHHQLSPSEQSVVADMVKSHFV